MEFPLALVGGKGWRSIPIALSNGKGKFHVVNHPVKHFGQWSGTRGAQCFAGDFNGDRNDDIACEGARGWATLPVAFGRGNGKFDVTNHRIKNFARWATVKGVQVLAGDINGDGRPEPALVGGKGWQTIPVAFSNGHGHFRVVNHQVNHFPAWATEKGAKCMTGDFNGDKKADIACEGPRGWATFPIAFGKGNGQFRVTNRPIANFASWAATPSVKLVSADFLQR
jgi:DNA gyrase inhibitor GyrI